MPARWSEWTYEAGTAGGWSPSMTHSGTSSIRSAAHGVRVVFLDRAHHEGIDAPRAEHPDVGGVERRITLRVHDQQRIAVGPQDGLGARRDVRDEVLEGHRR